MNKQKSVIITFYSYKGGVGRSMALANVAWLLANEYGKKVIVVDWDLEAPGLHRFFDIDNGAIDRGLIEMFDEYKKLLKEETGSLPEKLVDIDNYITSIHMSKVNSNGSLSILASGRQDPTYASRVNKFNWDEFYEKWQGFGFIEYLKEELKKKADIVLLDSRTGVTDIGGICTLQLPDAVLLLFALNEQNIAGAEFIAESILKKSPELEKREKPPILIIRPARVEKYLELKKKDEWERKASKRLKRYLFPKEQEDPLKFMKEHSIPYIGAYSFGETLAVEDSRNDEPAKSFDTLTRSLLEAVDLWDDEKAAKLSEEERQVPLSSKLGRYFILLTTKVNKIRIPITFTVFLLSLALYFYAKQTQLGKQATSFQQEIQLKDQQLNNNDQQMMQLQQQIEDQKRIVDKQNETIQQLLNDRRLTR